MTLFQSSTARAGSAAGNERLRPEARCFAEVLSALRAAAQTECMATAAVQVDYAGQTFAVARPSGSPADGAQDRSMQTLSLLQLIMGLQEKGTETPGVSNVRLLP